VGYAGGTKADPTYRNLGDHAEVVQIDFDPSRISYREMLALFWESHEPTRRPWSRQYMHAVFYHNDAQRRLAEETRDRLAATLRAKIVTQILPYKAFYLAEDYHQKHTLRRFSGLMQEFRDMYPSMQGLINSTAAARVNGYLAGHGTCNRLREEIDRLGVSERGKERLAEIVCGNKTAITCRSG
jgi:peptide-methionine (S)-S-oxide reductase